MKYISIIFLLLFGAVQAQTPIFRLRMEQRGQDASGNGFRCHFQGADSAFSTNTPVEGSYSYTPAYARNWESKTAYNVGTSWTFKCDLKYTGSANRHVVFTNMSNAYSSNGFNIYIDAGTNALYVDTKDGSGNVDDASAIGLTLNSWVDIIVAVSGTHVRVWINGTKQTLADSLIQTDYDQNEILGVCDATSNSGVWGWNGDLYIDNVHFYNYTVTGNQASMLYGYRNSSTFQLTTSAPAYNPPAGYKRPVVNGVEKRPTYATATKYMSYKPASSSPPVTGDTIEYLFAENFEGWTTANVNSPAAMSQMVPMFYDEYDGNNQSIVDVPGHGKVFDSNMKEGTINNLATHIVIGDTVSDIWIENDLWMPSDFNGYGEGGANAKKIAFGALAGGTYWNYNQWLMYGYPDEDTVTADNGKAGILHEVGGCCALWTYGHVQKIDGRTTPYTNGDGISQPDSGYYTFPVGEWYHIKRHLYCGTNGHIDGFYELYVSGGPYHGEMVARTTSLKFRSVTQGKDFGKWEAIAMYYFWGGDIKSACPKNESVRYDNVVAYRYKPGAVNYKYGKFRPRTAKTPDVPLPPTGKFQLPSVMTDETFTADTGTIMDVNKDKWYIRNPPDNHGYVTKVITKSGIVHFSFVRAHWGYGWNWAYAAAPMYYIQGWSGNPDAGGTLLYTFGRDDRANYPAAPNYTQPTVGATYTATGPLYFRWHTGDCYGDRRQCVIRYW